MSPFPFVTTLESIVTFIVHLFEGFLVHHHDYENMGPISRCYLDQLACWLHGLWWPSCTIPNRMSLEHALIQEI